MQSFSAQLLSSVSAAGAGAAATWGGGRGAVIVYGTFGGTAATLEYLANGTTWIAAITPSGTAVSLSAAGMALFEAPPGKLRAVLTGGAPVTVSAHASRIPA